VVHHLSLELIGARASVGSRLRRKWGRMRWTEQMAEAIVQLRAIHLSGDFDRDWQFHIDQDQHHRIPHTPSPEPHPSDGKLMVGERRRRRDRKQTLIGSTILPGTK
jgi:hypothetical protein